MSSISPRLPRVIFRTTEKIVPTGTLTSMLDEPSSGSNNRQYFPQRKFSGDVDDRRLLLRRHGAQPAAVVHRLDDYLVGDDVQLLLNFALDVHVFRGAEDVGQTGAADLVGDHLRGQRQVVEDAGELTRRLRVKLLLLDDEPLDGDD